MLDGRKRITTIIAACGATALGASLLIAAPTQANPDIDDVKVRVERLYHQAEQASERYNDARLELDEATSKLDSLSKELERQRKAVEAVRGDVASAVVSQYQGQALTTAAQVMLADDPQDFLNQLTTVSQHNSQRAYAVEALAVEVERLELREELAQREIDAIERTEATLAEEKRTIDEKAAEAEALLERLEAEEREVRPSRSAPRTTTPTTTAPVSGRAAAAVQYALAQVGDSYVWGASGPNAFDCSGLTSAAWAQAGVSLPHSSSAQMGSGTRVSSNDLRPGDLVFYYSPVSHVGIYIGNGRIVDAANPSTGVRVTSVFSMPFSGAVRPG